MSSSTPIVLASWLVLLWFPLRHAPPYASALDNGRALTPVAGWTAWNVYSFHPSQQRIEDSMRAMAQPRDVHGRAVHSTTHHNHSAGVDTSTRHNEQGLDGQGDVTTGPLTSLVDLGYVQVNVDDAWQACGAGVNRSFHDAAGNPLINLDAFPNMTAMTALGRSLGIETGWYMNNCQCSENQFVDPQQIALIVRRSAEAVARLGFTSLKLDSCGQFNNVTLWAYELNATGVPIAIENCHQGGMTPGQNNVPGQHCTGTTDISDCPYTSYRTSDDIQPTWAHVLNNVNSLVPFLGDERAGDAPPRSRPGGWAYGDALQTGTLGVLAWSGYTPNPDGWLPEPLVEDRSHFGMHCITSSPLILSFNVTNQSRMEMLWPIIANREALSINRQWAGTPGRLVTTIRPQQQQQQSTPESAFVLKKGQLGQVSGWGLVNPAASHGLTCPHDTMQLPGVTPTCNLLRVANVTLTEAQTWCSATPECAAFSYRDTRQGRRRLSAWLPDDSDANSSRFIVYFKDATQLSFEDSNFHAGGQVQTGWFSQIKATHAPPGQWRKAPCGGTVCPPHVPPCHMACFSIAPCCSPNGPTGETLDFADGEAQLWSKRLVDGSLALLFVNLGRATLTHSFTLSDVGLHIVNTSITSVAVRDVWKQTSGGAPISIHGNVTFTAVSGHDSRFIVLTPQP